MIWDSGPWKDDLLRRADSLEERMSQQRWHASTYATLEQDLMLGFYAIRKLHDSFKLADVVARQDVTYFTFKAIAGKRANEMNWDRLGELYDLSGPTQRVRNLRAMSNQFIHSAVFTIAQKPDRGFDGVFVASDDEYKKRLSFVEAPEIVRLFRSVGSNYPESMRFEWDSRGLLSKAELGRSSLTSDSSASLTPRVANIACY